MADTLLFEPDGVLVIDKHAGVTSHDIVGKIRRLYHTKRVGHTGTLDPMATGVLVVLLGRAAKAAEYLGEHGKTYEARLRLGVTTDTEDTTGNVLTSSDAIPSYEKIEAVLPRFRGNIKQIPPMYSAIKIGGQKLVDLARKGITVEREERDVTVSELSPSPTERPDEIALTVSCSAGTYIRTLCADIGRELGCGGAMAALRRSRVGQFSLAEAHTVDEIEAMSEKDRLSLLRPTESLFADYESLSFPAFYEKLCRSGCEIYQSKISTAYEIGTRLRLIDRQGVFYALGEVGAYPDGSAVKAVKFFVV